MRETAGVPGDTTQAVSLDRSDAPDPRGAAPVPPSLDELVAGLRLARIIVGVTRCVAEAHRPAVPASVTGVRRVVVSIVRYLRRWLLLKLEARIVSHLGDFIETVEKTCTGDLPR